MGKTTTGGILFPITLPKIPSSINANLMTKDGIRANLMEGYNNIVKSHVQEASVAFLINSAETHE